MEISRIVGNAGTHDQFDGQFMPPAKASTGRWKRIAQSIRSGAELPLVYLYKLGDAYFVKDGHNRASVARYLGVDPLGAEVTEFRAAGSPVLAPEPEVPPPVMPGMSLGLM